MIKNMDLDRRIRLIAGLNILGSLLLARCWSGWWLGFTAFVGVNLIQSAFSRWCLMEDVLRRKGWDGPPKS